MVADDVKRACHDAISQGWTVQRLAAKAGVEQSSLRRWLSGKQTEISLESASRLAEMLGLSFGASHVPPAPDRKRNSVIHVTVNGQTRNVSEWAEWLGISRARAHQLYQEGRLVERIQKAGTLSADNGD